MSLSRLAAFAVSLLLTSHALATDVGGPIVSNTTWTTAGSPYIVVSSIVVRNNAVLTIQPGVTVKFNAGGLGIAVGSSASDPGTLRAVGSPGQEITFTTNAGAFFWKNILFTDFATDAVFDANGEYLSGSILQHCKIESGTGGGQQFPGTIGIDRSSPFIADCDIRSSSQGITAKVGSATTLTLLRNTIANNNNLHGNGGGVWVVLSDVNSILILTNNTILNNQTGFGAGRGGGIYLECTGTSAATLSGNTISNNNANANGSACNTPAYGGGIYLSNTGSFAVALTGNVVSANTAIGSCAGYGGGLYVDNGGSLTVSMVNNTVSHNTAFTAGGGIYVNEAAPTNVTNIILTGDQTTGSHNTLVGNVADFGTAIYNNMAFSANGTNGVHAEYVCWGGLDPTPAVNPSLIYDYFDNQQKSIVLYSPHATGQTCTGAAGCGPSLIADCNGHCAPLSWIGDGICDSGFYTYNGVPIYFNCPQFGNDGGDCTGPTPPLTHPPNHGAPAAPPQYEPPSPPSPTQNKLILVTHGWDTDFDTYAAFWAPLRNVIAARVGPDWQVRSYDWTEESQTGGLPFGPDLALVNGVAHGFRLGREIGQQGYQHVHLIAHSAGSALIAAAASRIKYFSPNTTVHTTFLDAFGGAGTIPGVGTYEQSYGLNANWSDQYFTPAEDPVFGPFTDLRLPNSFNVNVALVDPHYPQGFTPSGIRASHTWPRCFFRYTVDGNAVADCDPPAGSPVNWLNWGFALSFEQWTGSGGVQEWIDRRQEDQRPGRVVTLYRADIPPARVFRIRRDPPIDLLGTPSFPSNAVAVQIMPGIFTMTTQPPSAPFPAPAWVNFEVATPASVNFITFNMAITGDPGAAGLVTMYVNGTKCGVVDQPYTLPGSQPYSMPTPGDLVPGQHFVSFRLDPINAMASSITVQNVATGMGKFTPACYANCDESTGTPNLTANDFQCFINKYATADPYANCDMSTGVPSLTANDFQCFINQFAVGCP